MGLIDDLKRQKAEIEANIQRVGSDPNIRGRQKSALIASAQKDYYALQSRIFEEELREKQRGAQAEGVSEEELYRRGLTEGQVSRLIGQKGRNAALAGSQRASRPYGESLAGGGLTEKGRTREERARQVRGEGREARFGAQTSSLEGSVRDPRVDDLMRRAQFERARGEGQLAASLERQAQEILTTSPKRAEELQSREVIGQGGERRRIPFETREGRTVTIVEGRPTQTVITGSPKFAGKASKESELEVRSTGPTLREDNGALRRGSEGFAFALKAQNIEVPAVIEAREDFAEVTQEPSVNVAVQGSRIEAAPKRGLLQQLEYDFLRGQSEAEQKSKGNDFEKLKVFGYSALLFPARAVRAIAGTPKLAYEFVTSPVQTSKQIYEGLGELGPELRRSDIAAADIVTDLFLSAGAGRVASKVVEFGTTKFAVSTRVKGVKLDAAATEVVTSPVSEKVSAVSATQKGGFAAQVQTRYKSFVDRVLGRPGTSADEIIEGRTVQKGGGYVTEEGATILTKGKATVEGELAARSKQALKIKGDESLAAAVSEDVTRGVKGKTVKEERTFTQSILKKEGELQRSLGTRKNIGERAVSKYRPYFTKKEAREAFVNVKGKRDTVLSSKTKKIAEVDLGGPQVRITEKTERILPGGRSETFVGVGAEVPRSQLEETVARRGRPQAGTKQKLLEFKEQKTGATSVLSEKRSGPAYVDVDQPQKLKLETTGRVQGEQIAASLERSRGGLARKAAREAAELKLMGKQAIPGVKPRILSGTGFAAGARLLRRSRMGQSAATVQSTKIESIIKGDEKPRVERIETTKVDIGTGTRQRTGGGTRTTTVTVPRLTGGGGGTPQVPKPIEPPRIDIPAFRFGRNPGQRGRQESRKDPYGGLRRFKIKSPKQFLKGLAGGK